MTTIHIEAHGGLRLSLSSDGLHATDPDFALILGGHVPGARVSPPDPSVPPRCIRGWVTHFEASSPSASAFRDGVEIRDAWGGRVGADGYHALGALARAAWQEDGLQVSHAGCIEAAGQGILVAGPSGCGKSTALLEALRAGRCRMHSGNRTLLDLRGGKAVALAGTATVTLRSSDAAAQADLVGWSILGPARSAGVLRHGLLADGLLPIGRVVLPRVGPWGFRREALGLHEALHVLIPLVSDAVNAVVAVAGGEAVVGEPLSGESLAAMVADLARALRGIEVVRVAGTAADVAREILA